MIRIKYSELGLISRNTAEKMIRGTETFNIEGLDIDDFLHAMDRVLRDEPGLYCESPQLSRKYCTLIFERFTHVCKSNVDEMIKKMQAEIKPTSAQ